tara:strand:- start:132 stop:359 length:228 start_codon:yes stop_codon:yes gene_type:complete
MKWFNLILLISVFSLIFYACDSPDCDLDGCSQNGIGWTNNPPSSSGCKGIPCRPVGAKKGTGYCSREHANTDIWN